MIKFYRFNFCKITNGLKKLHESIKDALLKDDACLSEKIYMVREFKDWKEMGDAIERELISRGEQINSIPW